MRAHAVSFAPLGLAARTFVVVAQLWLYDARITARQLLHARETVALIEAFLSLSATANAIDVAGVFERDVRPQQRVQRNFFLADEQRVLSGLPNCARLDGHLAEVSGH